MPFVFSKFKKPLSKISCSVVCGELSKKADFGRGLRVLCEVLVVNSGVVAN